LFSGQLANVHNCKGELTNSIAIMPIQLARIIATRGIQFLIKMSFMKVFLPSWYATNSRTKNIPTAKVIADPAPGFARGSWDMW